MKLITRFELAAIPTKELHALYSSIFNEHSGFAKESHERMNALASLENIRRELSTRVLMP
jgi:hypothetical protein